MPTAEKVVVAYGRGDSKKHSVKFEATGTEGDVLPASQIGDIYIMRSILDLLGIKDNGRVKVTFEKMD